MEKVVIGVGLVIIALLCLAKLHPEPSKAIGNYLTAKPKVELEKTDDCPPWCANGCDAIVAVGWIKRGNFVKPCRP